MTDLHELRKRMAELMGYAPYCKTRPGVPHDWLDLQGKGIHDEDWHPDESIEQAFMVAEKLQAQGKRIKIELFSNMHGRGCLVEINETAFSAEASESATTPALGICLAVDAWLKANKKK